MYKFKNPETASLNYDGRTLWAHDLTDEFVESIKEKAPGLVDLLEEIKPVAKDNPKVKAQAPKEV